MSPTPDIILGRWLMDCDGCHLAPGLRLIPGGYRVLRSGYVIAESGEVDRRGRFKDRPIETPSHVFPDLADPGAIGGLWWLFELVYMRPPVLLKMPDGWNATNREDPTILRNIRTPTPAQALALAVLSARRLKTTPSPAQDAARYRVARDFGAHLPAMPFGHSLAELADMTST